MNGLKFVLIICYVFINVCYAQDEEMALKKPEIYSLHIYSDIKYRFATTRVTSRVKNVHKTSSEAFFDVTLPNEAFITNLTLEIEGRIVVGEIKEKEAAKQQYIAAQQRGESAAYLGTKSRETNKFNLAVTVAAQSKISFNLTYQELLKRKSSQYEQVIYIDPGQPVEDMDITVAILESRNITQLRVPPLRNDIDDNLRDLSTLTLISQPTPKTAHVKFVPSVAQQLAQADSGMAGQFVVQYDVERGMDAGDVLIVNGYFVHFFAPEGLQPIPHNVLFILDVSGSMSGKKIIQLKEAMKSIILQLGEGDRMNIMTFSSTTNLWQYEMKDAKDEDVIDDAFTFVDSLIAKGGTDIELAIRDGLKFLNDDTLVNSTVRSPVIVFLTDGEATSGVTDKNEILRKVRSVNENGIPIFSLAFGENADYDIVKKIALQNNGFGRKIYEASDASLQIVGFYNEIAVTLLNNITFEYLDKPVENVTKHIYTNYFNGSEMVVCGGYPFSPNGMNATEMSFRISARTSSGGNIVLSGDFENIIHIDDDNLTKSGDFEEITEKIWAYLTIKQMLDKKLAADNFAEIEKYTKEVLELSLKYGFVTPLTSMVVTIPTELDDYKLVKPGVPKPDMDRSLDMQPKLGIRRYQPIQPPSNAMQFHNFYRVGLSGPSQNHPMDSVQYSSITAYQRLRPTRMPRQRKVKPKNKRTNTLKNKSKNKTKNKGFTFPLIVTNSKYGKDPLCLKLITSGSQSSSGVYLLHETSYGVRIEIRLEAGRKSLKQAVLHEIMLTSNSGTTIILPRARRGDTVMHTGISTGLWNVTGNGPPRVDVLLRGGEHLKIRYVGADELSMHVGIKSRNIGSSGIGILDQIMAANISLKRTGTSNKGREFGKFKIKNKKAVLDRRQLDDIYSDLSTCYSFKKNENKLIDMGAAKLPDFSA